MHPFLTNPRRLGLYLLGWCALAVLPLSLLAASARVSWPEACAISIPVLIVYGFACLSSWYAARSLRVGRVSLPAILFSHAVTAVALSGLWIWLVRLWTLLLGRLLDLNDLAARWLPVLPLLFATGVLLYLLAVAFHYVWLAVEESRAAQAREAEAQLLARDSELRALRAQVNPHFLFNTLNSISALTSLDPAKAREMCVLLADFLRRTLGLGEKTAIPLSEEIALARCYLAIEKIRFGSRLEIRESIEEGCAGVTVPPLLLQPLVENAVLHGIAALPEGGQVRIEARCEDGEMVLSVENPRDPDGSSRRGGLGLENVRRRLQTIYGSQARLAAEALPDRYRAGIRLPL